MVHILNVIKHLLNIVVFEYIAGRIWEFCPVSCFRGIIDPQETHRFENVFKPCEKWRRTLFGERSGER